MGGKEREMENSSLISIDAEPAEKTVLIDLSFVSINMRSRGTITRESFNTCVYIKIDTGVCRALKEIRATNIIIGN